MISAKYRPDIDGLRALAVLAVVLYHVGVRRFSGGFVGVDVFFVISGFLITGLVYEASRAGRFRFSEFYLRRARRLFPAAFVAFALTAVVASLLMASDHVKAFGGSLLHAALSASNFYFWRESGYFEADATLKPLLHTWSLAVEEQFYLLWPAFLVLLARRSRLFGFSVLLAVSVLGFASAVYMMTRDPAAAFFLMPLRVWEFAVGGLLVWSAGVQLPGYAREGLTITGIGMIAWSVFKYDADTIFPGTSALLPCLGTALTILAGDARHTGRLLRNPLSVWIGRTSYSFYLVHWPAIVFYKYYAYAKLGRLEKTALVLGSFALACLIFRYVEQPFRQPERSGRRFSSAAFALSCAGWSLASALIGAQLWIAGGFARTRQASNQRTLDYLKEQLELNDKLTKRGTCYTGDNDHYRVKECLAPASGKPNFLVVGDSYAGAAFAGMVRHFGESAQLSLAAATGCVPLLEPYQLRPGCVEQTEQVFNKLDLSAYDLVFLIGAFRTAHQTAGIKRAAEQLERHGARAIVVLGSPQSYEASVTETFKVFDTFDSERVMRRMGSLVKPTFLNMDRRMERTDLGPATYVSMMRVLCPERSREKCIHALPDSGLPIIGDATHLTPDGAAWVFDQLAKGHPPWRAIVEAHGAEGERDAVQRGGG